MNKVVEKLPYKVDVEKLVDILENHIKKLGPPHMQGGEFGYNNFGGWYLLNRTGKWDAYWPVGMESCKKPDGTIDYSLAKFLDLYEFVENTVKTEACIGYLSEVLDMLTNDGFFICNARLTVLKAGSKSIIHSDGTGYVARIHIPLVTNPKCVHWTEGVGEFHMPADGSVYMLWVNNTHQIRNDSDEDRYHIIMDAYDVKGITSKFKYAGNFNELLDNAQKLRKKIDSAILTEEQAQIYKVKMDKMLEVFTKNQIELSRKM